MKCFTGQALLAEQGNGAFRYPVEVAPFVFDDPMIAVFVAHIFHSQVHFDFNGVPVSGTEPVRYFIAQL